MNSADPAGCKYCKHCGNTSTIMVNAFIPLEKSSRETMYITNDCRLHYCPKSGRVGAGAKINNCPMCGRQLPDVARCSIESLPKELANPKRAMNGRVDKSSWEKVLEPEDESYTIAEIDEIIKALSAEDLPINCLHISKSAINTTPSGRIPDKLARIQELQELKQRLLMEQMEDDSE